MSTRPVQPPPLPEEAQRAMAALRGERPSAHFESRLHLALRAASAQPAPRREAPPRMGWLEHRGTRGVLSLALVTSVLILVVRPSDWPWHPEALGETMPLRHVAVNLSREGSGWLELPWTHAVHSGEPATVHLEAPAELNLHLGANRTPSMRLVGCEAGRCIHQFTAATGAEATPLRVRIDKPGRYEFRVSHVSEVHRMSENFVVDARHWW